MAMGMFASCAKTDKVYAVHIQQTDVAKLSLFTFDGKSESVWGLMNLGHAFLAIENISTQTISICHKQVHPGQTITFGTWAILDHFGVWYNVESNYIKEYDKYNGRVSVTTGVSGPDIAKISDYIVTNDKWNPFNNCSYFAYHIWNGVADEQESLDKRMFVFTPNFLAKQIKKFDTFETNKQLITETNFGYFDSEVYVFYHMAGVEV